MTYADGAPRRIVQGIAPMQITAGAAFTEGALLGYSSGWVLADANAGIPAKLVAGEACAINKKTTAYLEAVVDGFAGATAGNPAYLSDTAGGYAVTVSATSEQQVGRFLSATEAYVAPHRFQEKLSVSLNFAAVGVAFIFFVAPFRCRVTKISEVHATVAGQAGTLTVERLQGTEAPGSGDDLLATTKVDLTATINTVQSPALTATVAHLVLEVGERLCLKLASGAATSLANAALTVELERA